MRTINPNTAKSYYPFGMLMPGRTYSSEAYSWGFNGQEKDDEIFKGANGAEYWEYDGRLGRRWNVDPKAEKAPGWSSYRAFFNSPILFSDPDGQWEADSKGSLKAEKGDNASTLAKFQNINFSDALKQLTDQGYKVNNKGILNLKIGDKVTLNNVFTESINNSTSDFNTDAYVEKQATGEEKGTGPTPEDNYNCGDAAINGSQNQKIGVESKMSASTAKFRLSTEYTPTTKENVKFGQTVLCFADAGDIIHLAVYYGKNKAGEIYVYTKNGYDVKPEIMKLSDLQTKIPTYGNIKGLNPGDSGYYQPK